MKDRQVQLRNEGRVKINESLVLGELFLPIRNIPAQSFGNTFKFIACCHEDLLEARMDKGYWPENVSPNWA